MGSPAIASQPLRVKGAADAVDAGGRGVPAAVDEDMLKPALRVYHRPTGVGGVDVFRGDAQHARFEAKQRGFVAPGIRLARRHLLSGNGPQVDGLFFLLVGLVSQDTPATVRHHGFIAPTDGIEVEVRGIGPAVTGDVGERLMGHGEPAGTGHHHGGALGLQKLRVPPEWKDVVARQEDQAALVVERGGLEGMYRRRDGKALVAPVEPFVLGVVQVDEGFVLHANGNHETLLGMDRHAGTEIAALRVPGLLLGEGAFDESPAFAVVFGTVEPVPGGKEGFSAEYAEAIPETQYEGFVACAEPAQVHRV